MSFFATKLYIHAGAFYTVADETQSDRKANITVFKEKNCTGVRVVGGR